MSQCTVNPSASSHSISVRAAQMERPLMYEFVGSFFNHKQGGDQQ